MATLNVQSTNQPKYDFYDLMMDDDDDGDDDDDDCSTHTQSTRITPVTTFKTPTAQTQIKPAIKRSTITAVGMPSTSTDRSAAGPSTVTFNFSSNALLSSSSFVTGGIASRTASSIATTDSESRRINHTFLDTNTSKAQRCKHGYTTNFRTPKIAGSNSSVRLNRTSGIYQTPLSTLHRPSMNKSSVIVAIVEGRGGARGEIGISSIDLKKSQLMLSQFSDSPTYVKTITQLNIIQAMEIIMPNTACENGNPSGLFNQIKEHFQSTNIITVQRRYFNETKGLQYIKHLTIPECKAVELQIENKYYCLATTAALLKYVEFVQGTLYVANSLKVIFTGSENTTMIDIHTVKNLELIFNLKDAKSEHSLYGVLHNTKTMGGARLLRANILQPPCHLETINLRLNCIEELLAREDVFFTLQSVLERFLDVDHLLSLCVQIPKQETVKTAENKIGHVIYLKHTLEMVEPLRNALNGCKSDLLSEYSKSLNDPRYMTMLDQVKTIIHDECGYTKGTLNMRAQKCHAVKGNINGLLDVARRMYSELLQDIEGMIRQMSECYELPLRSAYSCARGFHVQLYCGGKNLVSIDQLPAIFIKKIRVKNSISFTTVDLMKINGRVASTLNEIYLMSNVIVSKLLSEIVDSVSCLYKLTEVVSTLDMLISFAQSCAMSNYVRPEFSKDTMAIKAGKHPILERISPDPPTANDTYICEATNFIIITGPNMSGKSTYMKQVALLQIMAQIGCYVPAQYASFRLINHIFSRMGSGDDIETNSSTFMIEMKEINYILSMKTDHSLILIDELGRGTSVEEGIGMCYAICEELISIKAFTMLTTHFMELTYLDVVYPNVCNNHFQVDHLVSESGRVVHLNYKHTMASGPTNEFDYGIKLAELSNLANSRSASSVLANARQFAADARQQLAAYNAEKIAVATKHRALTVLAKRLIQVSENSTLKAAQLLPYLQSIKQEYMNQQLSSIDSEDTKNDAVVDVKIVPTVKRPRLSTIQQPSIKHSSQVNDVKCQCTVRRTDNGIKCQRCLENKRKKLN